MSGLSLGALGGIEVSVTVALGGSSLALADIAKLAPGAVISLDTRADAPVDLLVNGVAVASGDIVETDDGCLAVELREIRAPAAHE